MVSALRIEPDNVGESVFQDECISQCCLETQIPRGKKVDDLKPLCGREGLVLSRDPSVMKTVYSLLFAPLGR